MNYKRLERLYHQEHLAVRRIKRKRLIRPAVPMTPGATSESGMVDGFPDGWAGHGPGDPPLTVVDRYTRECLAIEVDSCLSSRRVTRVLEWIVGQRGQPAACAVTTGGVH